MKVRQLIRQLVELDRDDAEVGLMVFDGSGGVTLMAAREAQLYDGRTRGATEARPESEYSAFVIIAGTPPPTGPGGPTR